MVFDKMFFDALLKREVERAAAKFDAEFDEKGTSWREHDEGFQYSRMVEEVEELEKAIAIPYGKNEDKAYRIYRLEQMHSEYIDVAICALMGADWCTESIRKADKEKEEKQ